MTLLTLIHVGLSLIGILAGLVVVYGFVAGKFFLQTNRIFLVTTIATSVTGFFYPIHGVTPGIVLGILSLIVLAIALVALNKKWTTTYIITSVVAEFFNVLVLIVQSFQKVPPLHKLAPLGTEPITNVAKVLALLVFVVLAVVAIRKKAFVLV
jgi:hypothetical protein